jgi:hypothetical protein
MVKSLLVGAITVACLSAFGPANAADYIFNEDSVKCEYSIQITEKDRYFSSMLPASIRNLSFLSPTCMKDNPVNRMLINNRITREGAVSDAKFATRIEEMFGKKGMLEKGYCIQSTNYPILAVAVDFETQAGHITSVKYSQWIPCER